MLNNVSVLEDIYRGHPSGLERGTPLGRTCSCGIDSDRYTYMLYRARHGQTPRWAFVCVLRPSFMEPVGVVMMYATERNIYKMILMPRPN